MCSDPRLLYTSNAVHARVSVPALLMMIHESVIYAFTVFGGGKFLQQESRPVLPATPSHGKLYTQSIRPQNQTIMQNQRAHRENPGALKHGQPRDPEGS